MMTVHPEPKRRVLRHLVTVLAFVALAAPGCGDDAEPTTPTGPEPFGPAPRVDILLNVDNSRGMADKQEVLAAAIDDLVMPLLNPPCVDGGGAVVTVPETPYDGCPDGSSRLHARIADLHIGVISSSIGSGGGNACLRNETSPTVDDRGHLLARSNADAADDLPTYAGKGFLVWDPRGEASPPGEGIAGLLTASLRNMVVGVGQRGCGYEAPLESWYRFLVDPAPYETLAVVDGVATPQGVDQVLLQQRADFVRPDSILLVLSLSDENDCSFKEFGQFWYGGQISQNGAAYHLPRARQECGVDPNDPCCKSCGSPPGECPEDPMCDVPLSDDEDNVNIRCFDQRRRYGIDFLYPVDRYIAALSAPTIEDRAGQLVPNPLFAGGQRDAGSVIHAGIVGVPWQLVARDPYALAAGFRTAAELAPVWPAIVGDPALYVAPADPHMRESIAPRPGLPDATTPLADPIHGHDFVSVVPGSELQYACIFDIPVARDCAAVANGCECEPYGDVAPTAPICAANPSDGGRNTLQVRAKANPSLRQLAVLRGLGDRGVVASVCPAQLVDPGAPDYGYRPAAAAVVDRMRLLIQP